MFELNPNLIEWIGYIGSIIVAVSLTMSSILKLRWYNLVGASVFSAYGFIIGAMPVAFLNLFISLVNVYFLYKMYSQKDFFKILHIRKENRYLDFFLDFYQKDLNVFFPGFYDSFKNDLYVNTEVLYFLVLRNAAVAGLFMGRLDNEGKRLTIDVDFAIPEYRDLKTGEYIYDKNVEFFRNMGIQTLCSGPKSKKHYSYLKKMGFQEEKSPDGKGIVLTKNIA